MIDADDRCLIVEDNFLILIDLEEMVQSVGFKFVDRAVDLPQAMMLVETTKYRFAFLDLDLGGASCLPVIEALRKLKTPFAVTTGFSDYDLPKLLEGALIISKPFSGETIKKFFSRLRRGDLSFGFNLWFHHPGRNYFSVVGLDELVADTFS